MIVACVQSLGDTMQMPYGERTIDFTAPFQRHRYGDLFRAHVGVAMDDRSGVIEAAKAAHVATHFEEKGVGGAPVRKDKDHDVLVHELFEHKVEPTLAASGRPVFVHDYPAGLCPLTKRQAGNPAIA